jgi:hypothetical protein
MSGRIIGMVRPVSFVVGLFYMSDNLVPLKEDGPRHC